LGEGDRKDLKPTDNLSGAIAVFIQFTTKTSNIKKRSPSGERAIAILKVVFFNTILQRLIRFDSDPDY
jgi:hypothetical protein